MNSPLQKINSQIFKDNNLNVYIKRDDLIHPFISGNKWRKSHYLLKNILEDNHKTALTFGGAYSNHIHAFSYACNNLGLNSIGIIRGEELSNKPLNRTLQFAVDNNMQLIFVSREEYKRRYEENYCQELAIKHNAYIVPEGGTTKFVVDGFADMVGEVRSIIGESNYFVPCGSGGTIAGINSNLNLNELVYGINVVKGNEKDLNSVIKDISSNNNYIILNDYNFGGYAKYNDELINFIHFFEKEFSIEIESVYSAKMFFAFFDLVKKGKFKNSNFVLVHTGGLQGKRHF